MSYLDPPDHDTRRARHRGLPPPAAPDAYPDDEPATDTFAPSLTYPPDYDSADTFAGVPTTPRRDGYPDGGPYAYRDHREPYRDPAAEPYPGDPNPSDAYPSPGDGYTSAADAYPGSSDAYPGSSDAYGREGARPASDTRASGARRGRHGGHADAVPAEGEDGATEPDFGLDAGRTARSRRERRGTEARKSRAGRNLPAAIGVGLSLGAVVVASLFIWRQAFIFVIAAAAGVAIWEMCRAVRGTEGPNPPMPPLMAGAAVMIVLAWFGGTESLVLGLVFTVLAVMIWRLADGPAGYQRDVVAATLIAVYVPFLAGFAVMLLRPADGDVRVIVTLAAVVLSDTGGYVAGVFFGKHPMAPTVSPKKSWEGTAGSLVATAVGGALLLSFLFAVPWWHGVLFGLVVSAASVLGDLAESLLKRDLGIKDMSSLLPGHGGLMDRLDSILFAVPTAFMLLTLLAPGSG